MHSFFTISPVFVRILWVSFLTIRSFTAPSLPAMPPFIPPGAPPPPPPTSPPSPPPPPPPISPPSPPPPTPPRNPPKISPTLPRASPKREPRIPPAPNPPHDAPPEERRPPIPPARLPRPNPPPSPPPPPPIGPRSSSAKTPAGTRRFERISTKTSTPPIILFISSGCMRIWSIYDFVRVVGWRERNVFFAKPIPKVVAVEIQKLFFYLDVWLDKRKGFQGVLFGRLECRNMARHLAHEKNLFSVVPRKGLRNRKRFEFTGNCVSRLAIAREFGKQFELSRSEYFHEKVKIVFGEPL